MEVLWGNFHLDVFVKILAGPLSLMKTKGQKGREDVSKDPVKHSVLYTFRSILSRPFNIFSFSFN